MRQPVYDKDGRRKGDIEVGAGGPIIRVGGEPVVDVRDQLRPDPERILPESNRP
jgi:hypothetical protein